MTTKQFKTGDVVTAKMGGPKMTVGKILRGTGETVGCMWFDQMYALHRDVFAPEALKKLASAR